MRNFISSHNIKLLSLLNTKVKAHNLRGVYQNICQGWCFTHNLSYHENGGIIVGWCPDAFEMLIMQVTSQFIHCHVTPKHGFMFYYTLYGFNDGHSRMELWEGLKCIVATCQISWLLLGDFNALSCMEDRVETPIRVHEITQMRECLNVCQLDDVRATVKYFT